MTFKSRCLNLISLYDRGRDILVLSRRVLLGYEIVLWRPPLYHGRHICTGWFCQDMSTAKRYPRPSSSHAVVCADTFVFGRPFFRESAFLTRQTIALGFECLFSDCTAFPSIDKARERMDFGW